LHTLFLFLFEFSFSFIFWINSLTTHETIIAVLFFLLFVFLLLPKLVSVSQKLKEGEMRGKT
jgi:Ca2+/Na+ antiporter